MDIRSGIQRIWKHSTPRVSKHHHARGEVEVQTDKQEESEAAVEVPLAPAINDNLDPLGPTSSPAQAPVPTTETPIDPSTVPPTIAVDAQARNSSRHFHESPARASLPIHQHSISSNNSTSSNPTSEASLAIADPSDLGDDEVTAPSAQPTELAPLLPALILQHPSPPSQNDPRDAAGSASIFERGEQEVISPAIPAPQALKVQSSSDLVTDTPTQTNFSGSSSPLIASRSDTVAGQTGSGTGPLEAHTRDSTSSAHLQNNARIYPPPSTEAHSRDLSYFPAQMQQMQQRKIWVKRAGQSATMVAIQQDDLVDDVRDKILRKYANSLGKSFDSPDVTLRIIARYDGAPRSAPAERMLSPEEDMWRTLDQYYPGGQTVNEALVIEIPPKRTPRPSPRQHHGSHGHISYQALDDYRPKESGSDYFPPMPAVVPPANHQTAPSQDPRALPTHVLQLPEHSRSMSVLQTGQVPPLPSPGAIARRHRPKFGRQHTSSPIIAPHSSNINAIAVAPPGPNVTQHIPIRGRPRHDSNASERPNGIPAAPPLPTPPAPEAPPTGKGNTPPTPLGREHHRNRPRKTRKLTPTNGTLTINASNAIAASLLDGTVPPINVLIVEDNIINLKLLEAFMKRLKVRWSTAMNGQIAVNKWRQGGFHLVLMDIQLPIMSGLDATKEIRRLERVNGIGVFSSSSPSTPLARAESSDEGGAEVKPAAADAPVEHRDPARDRLSMSDGLFKSPVIIVALTASSLQSDRHEALAAGCNDFLTKPVNFVWLERKVKEWGCMQALIDYDGWRQWKDFTAAAATLPTTTTTTADGKTTGAKAGGLADGVNKGDTAAKAKDKKPKKDRLSAGGAGAGDGSGSASSSQLVSEREA